MAISFVNAYAGAPAANMTTGNFSLASITGIAADDICICVWYSRYWDGSQKTISLTVGANFNSVESYTNATQGHLEIYWVKYAVGANYAFTCGSQANSTAGYYSLAFRGVDLVSPIDAEGTIGTGSSTTPDPPSVNVATGGAAVVAVCGSMQETLNNLDSDFGVSSTPSTFTSSASMRWTSQLGTDASSMAEYLLNQSAGACNPGTMSGFQNVAWVAHTIALKPIILAPPPFFGSVSSMW